jgi:hypothetical protein
MWVTIRDLRIATWLPYSFVVKAIFLELPAFELRREEYLDDKAFRDLQLLLMLDPEAGEMITRRRPAQIALCRCETGKRETRRAASYLLLVEFRIAVLVVYYLRQE